MAINFYDKNSQFESTLDAEDSSEYTHVYAESGLYENRLYMVLAC